MSFKKTPYHDQLHRSMALDVKWNISNAAVKQGNYIAELVDNQNHLRAIRKRERPVKRAIRKRERPVKRAIRKRDRPEIIIMIFFSKYLCEFC